MLTDVMVAFRDENSELAIEVDKRDEILDKEYKDEIKKLIKGSKMDEDELEVAVKAILSLKQIERAGDHVTNISESIIYLITGNRVELN
jgi:phosphate transport system protein